MSGTHGRVTQGGCGTSTSTLYGWMLSHECRVLEATADIPPSPHNVGKRRNKRLLVISFLKLPLAGFSPSFLMPTCAPKDDHLTLWTTDQFGFPMILKASFRAGMDQQWKKITGILLPHSCLVEMKHFLLEIVLGLGAGISNLQDS